MEFLSRAQHTQAYVRLMRALDVKTQVDLAEILGVRQSSISDAIRRCSLPDTWLLRVCIDKQISPVWIIAGVGAKYIAQLPHTGIGTAADPCELWPAAPWPTYDQLVARTGAAGTEVTPDERVLLRAEHKKSKLLARLDDLANRYAAVQDELAGINRQLQEAGHE